MSAHDPARIRPTRVLTPLGIGIGLSLLGDSTLYAVLPDQRYAAQAGVTVAMVGVLLGANRLVRLLFNGPVGALFDRSSRRTIMIVSLALGTVSTGMCAIGSGFALMLTSRLLWGAAWSGLWVGGNTMVLDLAGESDRGRMSGLFQMWFFIGVGCTSILGGAFTDLLGYRPGLWTSTALTALGVLLWLVFLPETRPAGKPAATTTMARVDPFPWRTAWVISVPIFVVRVVFAGAMAATTILWLGDYFGQGHASSWNGLPLATLTGLVVGMRMLGSVLAAPLAGYLSDRLGTRWGVLSAAMLVGALGAWMMNADLPGIGLAGTALAALAGASAQSLVPAIGGDRVDRALHGRLFGLMYSIGDLGSTLGPPLALAVVQHRPVGQVYLGCALLLGATALFSAWHGLHDRRRSRMLS